MPRTAKKPENQWFVYLLACANGRIYTGIATDPAARLQKHLSGKGAKFTQRNKPSHLLGAKLFANRSQASKMEYAVKKLSPARKRTLAIMWSSETIGD